uniref:Uncharacterized protein n=1 Tax=Angiostrongylus cantonensis TaxID=6313 RepID=A0A0K0DIM5_ANGCA
MWSPCAVERKKLGARTEQINHNEKRQKPTEHRVKTKAMLIRSSYKSYHTVTKSPHARLNLHDEVDGRRGFVSEGKARALCSKWSEGGQK